MYEGESYAHEFILSAVKDNLPHHLTGSVVAYFKRADGNTVRTEGKTENGIAVITMPPECYAIDGKFYLAITLVNDETQTVIYAASGIIYNTKDGEIVNGGNAIPSYDEIMSHLKKYLAADLTAKVVETEDGAEIFMKDVKNGETRAVIKNGPKGDPGFSPTAKVTQTADGATVEITDGNGTSTAKIKNGDPGEPGFTPLAKVTQKENGAYIEITDRDGTTSALIENGKSGESTYTVNVTDFIDRIDYANSRVEVDKTFDDIMSAVKNGEKVVCMFTRTEQITASHKFKNPVIVLRHIYSKEHTHMFSGFTGDGVIQVYPDGTKTNFISVQITSSGGNLVNYKIYADNTSKLPNPKGLIIKQGSNQWEYDGETEKTVEIEPPTSSLPWSAITDKPFYGGGKIELETETEFSAEEEGETFIFDEFRLTSGAEYKITFAGKTYTSAAIDISEDGSTIAVGNYSLLFGIGDTGEPFIIANMPGGANMGDKMAHGMIVLVDENTAAEVMGKKVAIKIESTGVVSIIKNYTYTSSDISDGIVGIKSPVAQLQMNKKYIVELNGVDYECETKTNENGMLYLGDFGVITGGGYNEPFVFAPGASNIEGIYALLMLAEEVQTDGSLTVKEKAELKQLDPIYVPTMSETTKGGAKVGKGLKMDGDALTVDEGEWELIETIVLEESVSEVVRTKEPNGTPYNYSAFMVATEHPKANFGGNYTPMYVYPGRGAEGMVSCGLQFANSNTKYATRSIFRLIGNFWDVYGYHGETTSASQMVGQTSAQRLVSKGELPSISYLKIFAGGGVKFSPEMIIKIYGVRA